MIIRANENKISYGIKELLFDTLEELEAFDIRTVQPGSIAIVTDIDASFILNNSGEWRESGTRIDVINGGSAQGFPREIWQGGSY